jgi:hypothetical protein
MTQQHAPFLKPLHLTTRVRDDGKIVIYVGKEFAGQEVLVTVTPIERPSIAKEQRETFNWDATKES